MAVTFPPHKQALVKNFVDRSFRDVADRDYIAARLCLRHELDQQFLWFALQAIEKYLKAILLYNGRNTKKLRHDIYKAFLRIQTIQDIPFSFPQDVADFVRNVDQQGANRYFEYPYLARSEDLLKLDKTVWHIRRYCFYLRARSRRGKTDEFDWFPHNLRKIQNPLFIDKPHLYRISFGLLEKVLSKKSSPERPALVWKNFYFGANQKHRIRYQHRSASANPTHVLHPEIFADLDRLVKFSAPIRRYFLKKFQKPKKKRKSKKARRPKA